MKGFSPQVERASAFASAWAGGSGRRAPSALRLPQLCPPGTRRADACLPLSHARAKQSSLARQTAAAGEAQRFPKNFGTLPTSPSTFCPRAAGASPLLCAHGCGVWGFLICYLKNQGTSQISC